MLLRAPLLSTERNVSPVQGHKVARTISSLVSSTTLTSGSLSARHNRTSSTFEFGAPLALIKRGKAAACMHHHQSSPILCSLLIEQTTAIVQEVLYCSFTGYYCETESIWWRQLGNFSGVSGVSCGESSASDNSTVRTEVQQRSLGGSSSSRTSCVK